MQRISTAILTSIVLLAPVPECRAEDMWSEWESAARSEKATGALVYLGGGQARAGEMPVSLPFREIAREARLDVLRLNWRDDVIDVRDDALGRFIAGEIEQVRRLGYSSIVLGGHGTTAWLALSTASSVELDGVVALEPGALRGSNRPVISPARQLDELAEMIAASKARYVAIALFRRDPLDDIEGGRLGALRQTLHRWGGAFTLIGRPADAGIGPALALGRFTRRYRDCLVEFIAIRPPPTGERSCDPSKGYAAGQDIGFPKAAVGSRRIKLRVFSDPALADFLGRWQGDNTQGAYAILEAIEIGQDYIDFRHGYAPGPGRSTMQPQVDVFRFRLKRGGVLTYDFDEADGAVRLRTPDQLEYRVSDRQGSLREKFLLNRQER